MTEVAAKRLDGIVFRRATHDDSRPTYGIMIEATDDLARTRGWAQAARPATPPDRFLAFRASVLRHDPDGFWVAEADGDLVGFGIAVQRDTVWYLAALHIRPAYQSRGIGAELVRRALAAARPASLLTVGADARNPMSNALYGRFGMFPETPLVELSGATWASDTGILRPGAPPSVDLASIDQTVLGMTRPQDHAFWGAVPGLHAFAVVGDRSVVGDRGVVGYAYVQGDGAIGPIAVLDPADLALAVEASIGVAYGLGATTARVRIPGAARDAVGLLLARGWRYGDGVTLVLTSAPWGRWDRYVTSGADALL
jgi:ribosomal protein S18 acetylase RimI-like enzyme